jgi:hypothetical protein
MMPEITPQAEAALKQAMSDSLALHERLMSLYRETQYEDLEHGAMALEIVKHTIEETLEHKGLGGHILGTNDPDAHRQAEGWKADVERIIASAAQLLTSHSNEDLEIAIKALTIAEGSLEEVAEKYQ